jgi:2-polyprenyl-6-methoxyphenol hydroxylase-like FAD-dependent oxidoreductase
MSHAIIGFGAVGQALARMFARRNIEVAVASRRSPEALAPQATAIGPTIHPKSLNEALSRRLPKRFGSCSSTPRIGRATFLPRIRSGS